MLCRTTIITKIMLVATAIVLTSPSASHSGPLRTLVPGGVESAFGPASFSESDIDYERPAELALSDKRKISITTEFESVIRQKQAGKVLQDVSAEKEGFELLVPLLKTRNFKSAYAGNAYNSSLKYMTDSRLARTSSDNKSRGSANAFAQQLGKWAAVGYFKNFSRATGNGTSDELSQRIASFSSSEVSIPSLAKASSEGAQAKINISKRFAVSHTKANEKYDITFHFADSNDDYKWPGMLSGERRETGIYYRPGSKYNFKYFLNKADYSNLDSVTHNSGLEVGRWLSSADYDSKNFYMEKIASSSHKWMLGYENYSGRFKLAGYIDIFGSVADLVAGYYLYHSNGWMDRSTWKYSFTCKKRGFTYRTLYAYTSGDAFLHFDSYNRTALSWNLISNENLNYKVTQHQLGFGLEKKIRKNLVMKYAFIQTVPLLDKRESPATGAPAPAPAVPQPSKKTRGGSLNLFSVDYLF